ncbi:hypothetical protein ABIE21_000023 [Conyzicola nivalis]|uniref:Uncharacterized protein n=1 Tax=Conyzicola nivalis TaxID=1477021 RepID=A0ABV2QI37_9MICO
METHSLRRRTPGVVVVLSARITLVACSAPPVHESSDGRLVANTGQAGGAHKEALAKGTVAWGSGAVE